MSDRFETALRNALLTWRIEPTRGQVSTLRAHFHAVVETNRHLNLTRVTRPEEAAVSLYADSVAVAVWASETGAAVRSVLDGGTGAGFPAVPVAVMQPRWQVLAVDARAKKARFLASVVDRLTVPNLKAAHHRVERLHPPPAFDLVLFKAVGKIAQILQWSQHITRHGGCVVAYKTPELPDDEEVDGQRAADRLGYRELDPFHYSLPRGDQRLDRTLRIFRRA